MNLKQIDETLNILHKAENYGYDSLTFEERKTLIINSPDIPEDEKEKACDSLKEAYDGFL